MTATTGLAGTTRRGWLARAAAGSAAAGLAWIAPRAARAMENKRIIPYPYEAVWPVAIRFLRIDRGYRVLERDMEAGYILFEVPLGDTRVAKGSLELLKTKDASRRPGVNVVARTDAGPMHLPHTILSGLADKVRKERGMPSAPPPPPPEKAPKEPEQPAPPKSVQPAPKR